MIRSYPGFALVALAAGCSAEAPVADSPAPTEAPGDSGLSLPIEPVPGGVSVDCLPTDNALRFRCEVTLPSRGPVDLSFVRADGAGPGRVHSSEADATVHEVPIYFLEQGQDYVVEAVARDGSATGHTSFTTGLAPEEIRSSLVVSGFSSAPYLGTNLPCAFVAVAVVYDTARGQLVWYDELEPNGTFGYLDMVRFTEDHTILGETGSSVVEVDRTGAELWRLDWGVDYTLSLHHDLYKRDGNYFLLYQVFGPQILDGVLVYDAQRAVVADWFSGDHLEIPLGAQGDWTHLNTVFVDDDRSWYLSSYTQDAVIKVHGDWESEDFGAVEWVLAGTPDTELVSDFALDWSQVGGEDAFGNQHDVQRLDDGRLVLLDNEHGRALLIELDEAGLVATPVGAYPTPQTACGPQGTSSVTSNGNVLVGCSGSKIRELSPAGLQLYEAEVSCESGLEQAVRVYPLEGW